MKRDPVDEALTDLRKQAIYFAAIIDGTVHSGVCEIDHVHYLRDACDRVIKAWHEA